MRLSDFVGNSAVKRRVEDMAAAGRLPHAVIIEGADGSGRRTLAGIIARIAACTGEHRPCGVCSACRADGSPDITVIEPTKSSITVDQIRDVRSQAYIVPNQSSKRVFIIPNAALMNTQAQNALLKVLEEPPATAMFILTCEYTRQLLSTVVSRSAVLTLSMPEPEEAERYIAANFTQYSADEIHSACIGSTIGGALAALSGGKRYLNEATDAINALLSGELLLHKHMRAYEKDRAAQKGIITAMCEMFHSALRLKCGASPDASARESVARLAREFTAEQLLQLYGVCERAVSDSEANMGGALLVTVLCASLSAVAYK